MRVRSVNILVRDSMGRTLLQFRDAAAPHFPLLWGFWGGAMSPLDATPAHCAARELAEELNIAGGPKDFCKVGSRETVSGEARLMLYRPTVGWHAIRVREGAGAAFFWRHEMRRIAVSKPVEDHLRTDHHLFCEPVPAPNV